MRLPAAILGLIAAAALPLAWALVRQARPDGRLPVAAAPSTRPGAGGDRSTESALETEPAAVEVDAPVVPAEGFPRVSSTTGSPDDLAAVALAAKVRGGQSIGPADLRTAEQLYEKHGESARALLVAVLRVAARQEKAARRYDAAARLLEKASALSPGSDAPARELLALRVDQGDWPGVERVARELLLRVPGDSDALQALAYALVRQDRSSEAASLLEAQLERRPDPALASLLQRIRRDDVTEKGLQQQTLSHFHVRYDGEAHEDVGREVLRVLERHYATLATAFDHQPRESIPVLLLSRSAYYGSADSPAWSGGRFDSFDGRVRIPIGGLTSELTPELDGTVLHELTHAFVADRSAGLAPRELHEGLAQWVEGRRTSEEGLRALMGGRMDEVRGFYLSSLAFVEQLIAERGQGGINDVLAAMARTRGVDEAFREVYGSDYRTTVRSALDRVRQRQGA